MSSISLRRSEAILRLLIALALGLGFIGFATRGHAEIADTAAPVPAEHALQAAPSAAAPVGTQRHL